LKESSELTHCFGVNCFTGKRIRRVARSIRELARLTRPDAALIPHNACERDEALRIAAGYSFTDLRPDLRLVARDQPVPASQVATCFSGFQVCAQRVADVRLVDP
jgi:hypothetical protein